MDRASEWSVRVLWFAGVEVPDKSLLAGLDREDRELQTRLPIGRRVLPDSRSHPDQQEPALLSPDVSIASKRRRASTFDLAESRCSPPGFCSS